MNSNDPYDLGSNRDGVGFHGNVRDDGGIELGSLFLGLWRRKWSILLLTLLFGILAFALVIQMPPLYTARASVMLDPRSVQVLTTDNVVSDLDLTNPVLETEVQVLNSKMLIERVIRSFEAAELEGFDPANQEPGLLDRGKVHLAGWAEQVQAMLKGAEPEAPKGAVQDQEARRVRRLARALQNSMTVAREGDSYIISVQVETGDPKLSAEFANRIVDTYVSQQMETRTDVVRNATQFLQERVDRLRAEVEQAESKIEDFRERQVEQSGLSRSTVERQLLELGTQLALARADLSQAQARYEQIDAVIEAQGIERAAELLTSPFVLSLRQSLSEAGRREAELAARFAEDHPDRRKVAGDIELLKEDLSDEVRQIVATLENDVEVARSRVTSIQESVLDMETRAAELSRAELELRQLEREASTIREDYLSMLGRLSETRTVEQLQRADSRRAELAIAPNAPSAPRVLLFTAFGMTLGFAIGIVSAFMRTVTRYREDANAGFHHAAEIEAETGLPVIAALLKEKWRSRHAMTSSLRDAPYQPYAERVRQLRMSLVVPKSPDGGGVCALLTSAVADETKTTTTLALAHMEVLANRSCVVLDFDLRRSHLAKELKYSAASDLAGVLLAGDPIDSAIHRVPDEGFDLITVKAPTPHLVDVTPLDRLQWLITELKSRYDLVLIDTAPLLVVSDTLRLAPLVDYCLLMVRQDETRRRAVVEAARSLEDLGARSISVVMTMVDPQSEIKTYGVASANGRGASAKR